MATGTPIPEAAAVPPTTPAEQRSADARFLGHGVEGAGAWRYAAVAAAPCGRLYAPPFNCGKVLEINPATGLTGTIGDDLPGGDRQYLVMVAAKNGRLYAPPCSAKRVLEVDPATRTARLIGEELPGGDMKYRTMVEAPDGRLFAPPYSAGRVLEVDPSTGTVRLIGPELPGQSEKYLVMALARNGRLYSPPCCCDQALEIDPATSSVRLIGEPVPWRGWKRYVAIAEGPCNGKLYAPPCWGAVRVLEIDPDAGTTRQIGQEMPELGEKYWAVAAGSNGRLYAPPCDSAQVLEIDPATSSTRLLDTVISPVRIGGAVCRSTKDDEDWLLKWAEWDDEDWKRWYDHWDGRGRGFDYKNRDPEQESKGAAADKGKYWAIAAAAGGRLYAPPYNANRMLEIDGDAGVAKEIGDEVREASSRKYQVITQGPDGRLYAPPGNARWALEVDPELRVVSRVGPEVDGGAWKKYVAVTAAASGKGSETASERRLYAPPCLGFGQVLEFGKPLCLTPPRLVDIQFGPRILSSSPPPLEQPPAVVHPHKIGTGPQTVVSGSARSDLQEQQEPCIAKNGECSTTPPSLVGSIRPLPPEKSSAVSDPDDQPDPPPSSSDGILLDPPRKPKKLRVAEGERGSIACQHRDSLVALQPPLAVDIHSTSLERQHLAGTPCEVAQLDLDGGAQLEPPEKRQRLQR